MDKIPPALILSPGISLPFLPFPYPQARPSLLHCPSFPRPRRPESSPRYPEFFPEYILSTSSEADKNPAPAVSAPQSGHTSSASGGYYPSHRIPAVKYAAPA